MDEKESFLPNASSQQKRIKIISTVFNAYRFSRYQFFFLKNFLRNTRFLDRQLLGSGHFCHPLICGNFAFYLDDEIGGKTTLDVEGFKLEVLKITSYQIFLIQILKALQLVVKISLIFFFKTHSKNYNHYFVSVHTTQL